jgi:hypothetical protein
MGMKWKPAKEVAVGDRLVLRRGGLLGAGSEVVTVADILADEPNEYGGYGIAFTVLCEEVVRKDDDARLIVLDEVPESPDAEGTLDALLLQWLQDGRSTFTIDDLKAALPGVMSRARLTNRLIVLDGSGPDPERGFWPRRKGDTYRLVAACGECAEPIEDAASAARCGRCGRRFCNAGHLVEHTEIGNCPDTAGLQRRLVAAAQAAEAALHIIAGMWRRGRRSFTVDDIARSLPVRSRTWHSRRLSALAYQATVVEPGIRLRHGDVLLGEYLMEEADVDDIPPCVEEDGLGGADLTIAGLNAQMRAARDDQAGGLVLPVGYCSHSAHGAGGLLGCGDLTHGPGATQ